MFVVVMSCFESSHSNHLYSCFIPCISVLLKTIEDIGLQEDNLFSNIGKLAQQGDVNPDHPVFGLKRDLIRLLGNMAYKHRTNQDMVNMCLISLLLHMLILQTQFLKKSY